MHLSHLGNLRVCFLAHTCIMLPFAIACIAFLCICHTFRRLGRAPLRCNGDRALIVVAHPDDESLFFSNYIKHAISTGMDVHILCLSTGLSTSLFAGAISNAPKSELDPRRQRRRPWAHPVARDAQSMCDTAGNCCCNCRPARCRTKLFLRLSSSDPSSASLERRTANAIRISQRLCAYVPRVRLACLMALCGPCRFRSLASLWWTIRICRY